MNVSEELKFYSSLIFLFRVRTPIVKNCNEISEEISEVSEELKIVSSLKVSRSNAG